MGRLVLECQNKKIKTAELAKAVYAVLEQTDNLKAELIFVSANKIRELNASTRGVDKVTDVLSYPTLDGVKNTVLKKENHPTDVDGKYLFIGSIVMCLDKIREQAQEYGHSEERERQYLTIHGLMHLFGFDHMTEQDKKEMRQKEKAVMAILGIQE